MEMSPPMRFALADQEVSVDDESMCIVDSASDRTVARWPALLFVIVWGMARMVVVGCASQVQRHGEACTVVPTTRLVAVGQ